MVPALHAVAGYSAGLPCPEPHDPHAVNGMPYRFRAGYVTFHYCDLRVPGVSGSVPQVRYSLKIGVSIQRLDGT
jgi:hypothetical protein